jgi:hypothetical protein
VTANGVRAEWTSTPQDNSDAALLYLHGGGYVIGSLDSHRHLVAEAGRAAGCWALALDYAAVGGGSQKPNEIKVRRLYGAWVRETPYSPNTLRGAYRGSAGVFVERSELMNTPIDLQ